MTTTNKKNKIVQAFLSSGHRGSLGNPAPMPSAMPEFDAQWAADGWTAGGWSSWTGGNGGEDQARRIDSDAMQKRIEKLEARVSILEEEVAAWRKAQQAAWGCFSGARAESA